MRYLTILLIGLSTQPLQAQLDTVGFPLDIGNRWFYRHHSSPPYPVSEYLIIKTIVDTSGDGARIVRIGRTGTDSIGTETWSVINGSFYVNSVLLYNSSLLHDTTWTITYTGGYTTYTYQLRTVTLFGSTRRCQIYSRNGHSFPFSFWSQHRVALGVGWYYEQQNGDAGGGYNYGDVLIGLLIHGTLYGDSILTSVHDGTDVLPSAIELKPNYPNPFNSSTTIQYELPTATHVVLKLYDPLGREVATLVDDERKAGYHTEILNASHLSSGVYFCRIQAGKSAKMSKLILLK
jgi:hypothetical protein